MRLKHLFFTLVAIAAVSSCSNDESGYGGGTDNVAPVSPTSKALSYVSIYADEACLSPVIENAPLTDATTDFEFPLPYGTDKVYVKYPTTAGERVMEIAVTPVRSAKAQRSSEENTDVYEADNTVAVTIPLPETAVKKYVTNDEGFTNYHSSGVVMFEDTWPDRADAIDNDYNDIVVDYDLEATTVDNADTMQTWREDLKVVMHVRAKGGGYANRFGLLLEGLDRRYVDESVIDIRVTQGNWGAVTRYGLTASIVWDGNHPIIYINDLYKLINSKNAQENDLKCGTKYGFYNVENDESLNVGKGLFTVTVVFRGKDRKDLTEEEGKSQLANYIEAVNNTRKQNFFMIAKRPDGREYEAHMRNYAPTSFYTNYEADKATGVAKDPNSTYCAADGYVWGFKTPVFTRHTVEKVNFYKAYPLYEEWVLSNGSKNEKWYKEPNGQHTENKVMFNGKNRTVLKYISEWW